MNGALATPEGNKKASEPAGGLGEGTSASSDYDTPTAEAKKTPADHPIDWGENIFYKQLRRSDAEGDRRSGSTANDGILPRVIDSAKALPEGAAADTAEVPSVDASGGGVEKVTQRAPSGPAFPFHNAASLLRQCRTRNLTIAQVVYENELTWHPPDQVTKKVSPASF